MRAAGVLRDISPNRAGALARRIGGEEVAAGLHCERDIQVHHAGLHHGTLILDVDVEDLVHAGESDDDSAGAGNRATAQAGTGAAAYDFEPVLPSQFDDRDHVIGGAGKGYELGEGFIDAAVIFIQFQIGSMRQDGVLAKLRL